MTRWRVYDYPASKQVIVKEGFSWPCFLFWPIWALLARVWVVFNLWVLYAMLKPVWLAVKNRSVQRSVGKVFEPLGVASRP